MARMRRRGAQNHFKIHLPFAARGASIGGLWDNPGVMRLLLLLAGVAAVVGVAAPARADDKQDQAFLVALGAAGITYQNADATIATGKKVCDMAKEGKSAIEVVAYLQGLSPQLTQPNAARFTAIAAGVYCPEQLPGSSKPASG